jgi:arabinogalactan oligomer / maltooligosaccharide transport system substrate-binding protein
MKKYVLAFILVLFVVALFPFEVLGEQVEIVFWHSYRGQEKAALEQVSQNFAKAYPDIKIKMLQVPYDAFADKITAAIPRGKGPDVFIFGHDRIGDWVERESLEPIGLWVTDELKKKFIPITLEALTYEDALYGLPTAVKCVSLIYNKKLVKTPPKTTDELIKMAKRLNDPAKKQFGLVYENALTYYNSGWLFGFGGGIFDKDDNPMIDSEGNVKALTFVHRLLRVEKVMPDEISNTLVTALFNKNQAAMIMSGPWFLGEIDKSIDFGVAPLPIISEVNGPAKPFLTAEAVIMSSKCAHKKEAFELMKYFSSKEAAIIMATKGNQPVANLEAYEVDAVKNHPYIPVFRKQADVAVPMPNIPEMKMVWTPFDLAIGKVLNGTLKPKQALKEAQEKVSNDVKKFRGE